MTEILNPSDKGIAVTPHDTTSLELADGTRPRSLYVGSGGDVAIDFGDGTAVVFSNVASGTVLPIRPEKVKSTSTTASDIVALY